MPILAKKKLVILGVETSCDETAISIIEARGDIEAGADTRVLSNVVVSQIDIHKPYGGVFPALAKREHSKNLTPLLRQALGEAGMLHESAKKSEPHATLEKLLEREPELLAALSGFLSKIKVPKIDAIAVTYGPGLEPALWVGINFARALSITWGKPIIPVNHMEGHVFSSFLQKREKESTRYKLQIPTSPALALLISGGHTEIVLMKGAFRYKVVGATRDDAVGEAFDKAARILGLPYPGGPEIAKRAEKFRKSRKKPSGNYVLPRPMIRSDDFDFSFSGIKTAVLYMVQKIKNLTEAVREEICFEFEEAVTETLLSKMRRAAETYRPGTILMGGGVSANMYIQKVFQDTFEKEFPGTEVLIPTKDLTTDNALMIAAAGFARASRTPKKLLVPGSRKMQALRANGNLEL